MDWFFRSAAALVVATLFGVASPAAAQSSVPGTPAPTASQAPAQDASETAGPRRRPTPRSQARRPRSGRAALALPDSVVRTVSSRDLAADAASYARFERIENTLREAGPDWIGIPYRWGGTTRRGIDCSAFVRQYVRQTLGVELPRTTATQRYEGVHIDRDQLLPGDLVFFRRRGTRHVGVYLSDGEFIHASSSRGVTISNLSSSYWNRHYWMSRRIVTEPSDRRPTPRREAREELRRVEARGAAPVRG